MQSFFRIGIGFFLLFGLFGCSEPEANLNANPGFHEELHEIQTKPLPLDEDMVTKFESELEQIVQETNLDPSVMTDSQINKAARYLGYFGRHGQAIGLYETAMQEEKFQGYVAMHHNLGRLYEDIKQWDLAIERYTYLVAKGYADYQKDIEKIETRKSEETS